MLLSKSYIFYYNTFFPLYYMQDLLDLTFMNIKFLKSNALLYIKHATQNIKVYSFECLDIKKKYCCTSRTV